MALIKHLADAMERQDRGKVESLSLQLETTSNEALGLSPREFIEIRIEVADWLAEQGMVHQAMLILKSLLSSLRRGDAVDVLMIAAVADRLGEIELTADLSHDAAEALRTSLDLTAPIEGSDSHAVRWRMERCADALRRAGDSSAAAELDQERGKLAEGSGFRNARRRKPASQEASAAVNRDFELVTVHFGTHRARTGRTNPNDYFRGKRNRPMTYGKAVVSLPRDRDIGTLPTPPSWMREERVDPARYVLVKSVDVVDGRATFFADLSQEVAASTRKEALVFVHGYNTSFASAAMRTAQLAVDLEIDGVAVLYSWPSKGNVLSYLMDRNEAVDAHILDLEDFIRGVALESGTTRVHLVAHSMGSEFLLKALESLERGRKAATSWLSKVRSSGKPAALFSEIVFASPDVDALDFADRVPAITSLARRVTVYASKNDLALKWSRLANGEDRAGASAETLARTGIDCIDTSNSGANVFGHDDYVLAAMDDLRSVIWLSLEPRRRRALRELKGSNGIYWVHDRDALGEEGTKTLRQALIWARRLGIDDACGTISRFLNPPAANAEAVAQEAIYRSLLQELNMMR